MPHYETFQSKKVYFFSIEYRHQVGRV